MSSSFVEFHRQDSAPYLINLEKVWAICPDPKHPTLTIVSCESGSLTVTESYQRVRQMLGFADSGEAPAGEAP